MQVTLWPFWSQQNKLTGEFLPTCGNVKQLVYLADVLTQRGYNCLGVLPDRATYDPWSCSVLRVRLPEQNPVQRVHWDSRDVARAAAGDVLITSSDYLAIPARVMNPKLKIVQMCNVQPDDSLFFRAFRAADLTVGQSDYVARELKRHGISNATYWPLAYDERDFERAQSARDIDVCFVQRCSADNSTHHEEYIAGMRRRTVFTDVTSYLRMRRTDLEYTTPRTYIDTLFRSKVAVSMHRSWYGGLSIREAIRAGCTPVCLDSAAYHALLGSEWPYYCTPRNVHDVVDRALAESRQAYVQESYQMGALKAVDDVDMLGRS